MKKLLFASIFLIIPGLTFAQVTADMLKVDTSSVKEMTPKKETKKAKLTFTSSCTNGLGQNYKSTDLGYDKCVAEYQSSQAGKGSKKKEGVRGQTAGFNFSFGD